MLDIKEDIRGECSKLGEVTNVVLFDKELDGVASVRYSTPEAAQACVRVRITLCHPATIVSSPLLLHT
jgi:HIV Tat-specific factor 1